MGKNLLIKILIVLLAVLFWILQSLWRDHQETLTIPVHLQDMPSDLIILNEEVPQMKVNFEARGLDFVVFSLAEVYFEINAENFEYGINSVFLKPGDLRNQGRIKLVQEDFATSNEFTINLDKVIERDIPINIQFVSASDEEFFLKNRIADTEKKITVNGPKSIIDELDLIDTEKINRRMLKDGKIEVGLIIPDPRVRFIKNLVVLDVTEAKQINRILSLIPIQYPLDQGITIIPQKISVMIIGPQDIIDAVEKSSINAYIDEDDLKRLKPGDSKFVPVKFIVPTGVKLVEYTPQQIQIIKND